MKKRRGELTTQQIVLLTILIISFVVILFLLFRLNLGEESKKELCRNSVVLKGKSAISGSTSLNCQRTYKCITEDGTCEKIVAPDEIVKIKNADEAYKTLADEIIDCWWMFGEGKIDYVGKDFLSKNYCSICSQIVLDDSLSNVDGFESSTLDKRIFYEYLAKTPAPRKDVTYLQYLYSTGAPLDIPSNAKYGKISFNEPYFVVMGIKSEVGEAEWIIGGTLVGIGAGIGIFFTAPISVPIIVETIIVGALATAGGAAGSYVATSVIGESGNEYLSPTIIGENSSEFKSLKCDDILTLS